MKKSKTKRINDIQISKNFKLYEFESPDTHQVQVYPNLLQSTQRLRDRAKRPIHITSGYRTSTYNKAVGGKDHSQHKKGKAVDVTCRSLTVNSLYKIAKKCGFTFIKLYKKRNFLHCDVR